LVPQTDVNNACTFTLTLGWFLHLRGLFSSLTGKAEPHRFDDGEATSQEAFAFGGIFLHVRPPQELRQTPDPAKPEVRGVLHREVGGLGSVETAVYPCQLAVACLGELLCRSQ